MAGPLAAGGTAATWIIPQLIFKGDAFWRLYAIEQAWWKVGGGDRGSAGIADKISGIFFYASMFLTRFFSWFLTSAADAVRITREKSKETGFFSHDKRRRRTD